MKFVRASPRFRQPANTLQRLWRYVSYDRLVDLLASGTLYFCNVLQLPDGLEGSLTERTREKLFHRLLREHRDVSVVNHMIADYEKSSASFFVNCWHMNDIESNLMWKAYADRGYAIRTTWERLAIAFDGVGDDVQPVVLDYIDFEISEIEIGNIFTAIIKKDIAYQDEREFRLMLWQPKHLDFHHPPPPGIKVPIDVGKLIDRIYVSPSVRGIPTDLEALLASHGLLNSVYRSSVKERF